MPGDKYKDSVITKALSEGCHFTTGEYCAQHGGNWDGDHAPEFKLSYDDPRYIRVRDFAHELKKNYPLDALDPARDQLEIVARERAIVMALSSKIHEEYGDYNPTVSELGSKQSAARASLHDDSKRANTDKPAELSEFARHEMICRHYAPLIAAACTEAGMQVFTVTGQMNNFYDAGGYLRRAEGAGAASPVINHPNGLEDDRNANPKPAKPGNFGGNSMAFNVVPDIYHVQGQENAAFTPAFGAFGFGDGSGVDGVLPRINGVVILGADSAEGTSTTPSNSWIVSDLEKKDRKIAPRDETVGHMYVVSRVTGNVIEATSSQAEDVYFLNVNGVSVDGMVAGQTIVAMGRGGVNTYGTYRHNAEKQDAIFEKRVSYLAEGKPLSEMPVHVSLSQKSRADFEASLVERTLLTDAYDNALAERTYRDIIQPKLKAFREAVDQGKLGDVKQIAESFPVPESVKRKALIGLVQHQKHPEVAKYLVEVGALKDWTDGKSKADILFLPRKNGVAFNKEFTKALVGTLSPDPKDYITLALDRGVPEHIALAVELSAQANLSPELLKRLEPFKPKPDVVLPAPQPDLASTPKKNDFMSNNQGLGIGGILGLVLGWVFGGGLGALIGVLLGGGVGAVADGKNGILGLGGADAPSPADAKIKLMDAAKGYAKVRFIDFKTGEIDQAKVDTFVARYESMVANGMTPEEQSKRAAEIEQKTTQIKGQIRTAANNTDKVADMEKALKAAVSAMETTDRDVIKLAQADALPQVSVPGYKLAGIKKAAENLR